MRIGIFDSGIGGMTVLKALRACWPGHSTIYLGDTARVPYGTTSPRTVERYALKAADLLLDEGIELLVIACNTASANALSALQSLPVPVVGVIEPGAAAAVRHARESGLAAPHIGVIATRATTRSGAYQSALKRLLPEAHVSTIPCPLLVSLADEGWEDTPVARDVVRTYLADWLPGRPDRPAALVLGCTHFPLLKPALTDVLGPEVALIDSAESTAHSLHPFLDDAPLDDAPSHRLLVTDPAQGFQVTAARMLGQPVEFETVDFAPTP